MNHGTSLSPIESKSTRHGPTRVSTVNVRLVGSAPTSSQTALTREPQYKTPARSWETRPPSQAADAVSSFAFEIALCCTRVNHRAECGTVPHGVHTPSSDDVRAPEAERDVSSGGRSRRTVVVQRAAGAQAQEGLSSPQPIRFRACSLGFFCFALTSSVQGGWSWFRKFAGDPRQTSTVSRRDTRLGLEFSQ